jgi:hypothetical protein
MSRVTILVEDWTPNAAAAATGYVSMYKLVNAYADRGAAKKELEQRQSTACSTPEYAITYSLKNPRFYAGAPEPEKEKEKKEGVFDPSQVVFMENKYVS